MKFEAYSFVPSLKNNLAQSGFKRPTDIQFKCINPILKGEDVLAIAPTGTGKTAAFAIPIIQRMVSRKRTAEGIRCLIMVPTHELALQIDKVFAQLTSNTPVTTLAIIGGVEQELQIARLAKRIDVLIATPGRMFDLAAQGHLQLENVEVLVLDEADHMLDLGFINDIRSVKQKIPLRHQTLFFSATINDTIKKTAYSLVRNAIRIQVSPKDPVSKNVTHSVAFIGMDDKRFFLERLINEHPDSKILVFVRTKVRAERVCKALERVNLQAETIHGDKEQNQRAQIMDHFRSGKNKVLVATDVSARGIDIPNVEYVINYDLPEEPQNYVHRVGRTGRGVQKGVAVSFCSPEEKELLDEIEIYLGSEIAVIKIPRHEYEETIDLSPASEHDWQKLIEENDAFDEPRKKQGGKKRK